MFFMKLAKKVIPLVFISHIICAQETPKNEFIDPEIQNYFETLYGYKNPSAKKDSSFRDSPISFVNEKASVNESLLKSAYKTYRKQPSDPLPLYYSVKKAYDSGPLSSCVIEPQENNSSILPKYSAVEITVSKQDWQKVYSDNLLNAGFVLGGEEDIKSGKTELKTLIGWIPEENLSLLRGNSKIKSVYFSKRRGLKAPMASVNLILKAPADRDPALFSEAFSSYLSKLGFVAGEVKNVKTGPNARFYLIEIGGSIPIDKTDRILADPFVLKLNSQI